MRPGMLSVKVNGKTIVLLRVQQQQQRQRRPLNTDPFTTT